MIRRYWLALNLLLATNIFAAEPLEQKIKYFTFNETQHRESGAIVYPQKLTPRGVIIWSHGKGGKISEDVDYTLKPLSNKGFIVVAIDYRQGGIDSLEDIRALFQWVVGQKEFSSYPIYLAGFSLGARMAILTACYDTHERLKAIATIGSASEWDIPEISPAIHLQKLSAPLLIIHGEKDVINGVHEAYALKNLCEKYHKPHDMFIIKNASHNLDGRKLWNTALERVAEYFSTLK
jgi:dipeptidyl aminopeptidase/acylaminoacyl peptidase